MSVDVAAPGAFVAFVTFLVPRVRQAHHDVTTFEGSIVEGEGLLRLGIGRTPRERVPCGKKGGEQTRWQKGARMCKSSCTGITSGGSTFPKIWVCPH